jgi:hypothetical protein
MAAVFATTGVSAPAFVGVVGGGQIFLLDAFASGRDIGVDAYNAHDYELDGFTARDIALSGFNGGV